MCLSHRLETKTQALVCKTMRQRAADQPREAPQDVSSARDFNRFALDICLESISVCEAFPCAHDHDCRSRHDGIAQVRARLVLRLGSLSQTAASLDGHTLMQPLPVPRVTTCVMPRRTPCAVRIQPLLLPQLDQPIPRGRNQLGLEATHQHTSHSTGNTRLTCWCGSHT